jgi:hypothetical protein
VCDVPDMMRDKKPICPRHVPPLAKQ